MVSLCDFLWKNKNSLELISGIGLLALAGNSFVPVIDFVFGCKRNVVEGVNSDSCADRWNVMWSILSKVCSGPPSVSEKVHIEVSAICFITLPFLKEKKICRFISRIDLLAFISSDRWCCFLPCSVFVTLSRSLLGLNFARIKIFNISSYRRWLGKQYICTARHESECSRSERKWVTQMREICELTSSLLVQDIFNTGARKADCGAQSCVAVLNTMCTLQNTVH